MKTKQKPVKKKINKPIHLGLDVIMTPTKTIEWNLYPDIKKDPQQSCATWHGMMDARSEHATGIKRVCPFLSCETMQEDWLKGFEAETKEINKRIEANETK